MDKNVDGKLSYEEWSAEIKNSDPLIFDSDLKPLFEAGDLDGDELLTFEEY